MSSGSSTQSTTIPPPSAQEIRFMNFFEDQILPMALEESGFRVTEGKPEGLTPQEQEDLRVLEAHVQEGFSMGGPGRSIPEMKEKIRNLTEKRDKPVMSIEKIFPPDIEKLGEEFGRDSDQFKDAVKAFEGKKFEAEDLQRDLVNQFQQNTLKFLSGDFSMTPEEQESMNELFAPERELVKQFGDKQKEIIEKGIKETAEDVTRQIQERAVASGRDPGDPEFQNQIAENVASVAGDARAGVELDILSREQGIEQGIRNLRLSQLTGGGAATAQSSQLTDAINQARILNLQGISGQATGQANQLGALRASQPTTTSTSSPSPLSIGLGLGSLFLGGATGFAQAAALRQLANTQAGG